VEGALRAWTSVTARACAGLALLSLAGRVAGAAGGLVLREAAQAAERVALALCALGALGLGLLQGAPYLAYLTFAPYLAESASGSPATVVRWWYLFPHGAAVALCSFCSAWCAVGALRFSSRHR